MQRCLKRISDSWRENKYSVLQNVVSYPAFQSGEAKTTFIDNTPELFEFPRMRDRGNKTMKYIGEVTVNGFPGIERTEKNILKPRACRQILKFRKSDYS